MNNLAARFIEAADLRGDELQLWVPEEAPLAMPRQDLGPEASADALDHELSGAEVGRRRRALFLGTLLLTALVATGPYVLAARKGWDLLEIIGFAALMMLAAPIACWFLSGLAGFVVLLRGQEQDDLDFAPNPAPPRTRTALLMPLCNEDARAAMGRLAAIDGSLARLGVADAFDIFVLSDSSLQSAPAERAAFQAFRAQAHCRAHLRRRERNVERKAGNISDWVRRHGGAYDFMIVLDADSVMAGETILRLVDAMERRPELGLIQTTPTIVGASTLFGRISQFSVRMYGRVAAAGYAWWTGAESGYWGHNAIVRTRAFAACAGLPVLEGEKPFGGHVLSHDVVEAALLRRGGWGVRLTAALDGSCEETPPTILDFIRRDHRWCQGNLQHLAVLGAPGLHPASRAQLFMGCVAYLASPLWLTALAVGLAIQLRHAPDWSSFWYFLNPQLTPFMLGSLLSGVLLMGPKLMGAWLVLTRPGERRAFGGGMTVVKGVLAEMALSIVLAPILMVANTRAVLTIVRGRDVGWKPQQRDADGISWSDAFRGMAPQMLAGLAFSLALCFRPDMALSFAPIVLPLLFAAPLAVWTSRRANGEALVRAGYLVTPEDGAASATPAVRAFGGYRAAEAA